MALSESVRPLTPGDGKIVWRLAYDAFGLSVAPEIVRTEYQRLWSHGHPFGIVLENDRPLAMLVTVLLDEDFIDEAIRSRTPYVHGQIARSLAAGGIPFVSADALAQANADSGVSLFVAYHGWDQAQLDTEEIWSMRAMLFKEYYRRAPKHRIRRILAEVVGPERLRDAIAGGFRIVNGYPDHVADEGLAPEHRPYLLEMNRSQAIATHDFSLIELFSWRAPHLGLTPVLQQVASLALESLTDQEIATHLGVGYDAVRKRFGTIYEKFHAAFPGQLPANEGGGRSQEKRRIVLRYLQEHLEELAPYDGGGR